MAKFKVNHPTALFTVDVLAFLPSMCLDNEKVEREDPIGEWAQDFAEDD